MYKFKKKIIVLFLALFLVFSAGSVFGQSKNGFALGIGYTANGYNSRWGGGMISLHIPKSALVFDVYPFSGVNGFGLTISGDVWLVRNVISGPFAWYLGPGLWMDFRGLDNIFGFAVGGRIVVGLQLWPAEMFEIFLEAAPGLGIQILPTDEVGLAWPIPISLGLRLWF